MTHVSDVAPGPLVQASHICYVHHEMAKIPKSDQSQKTSRKYNQRNKWANTDPPDIPEVGSGA
jgi:hypothetical protein